MKVDPKDQPTLEEKKATLKGQKTGWDFVFKAPGGPTAFWGEEEWIAYIGDNWFKIETPLDPKEQVPTGPIAARITTPYPFCRTPFKCHAAHRCMAEICCAD